MERASGLQMKKSHQSRVESKIRRVTKISISEEIAKQIMDLISNGDLKPGEHLPSERELCKTFGASRSSLREALRCLSIVGVLNARVGEGTSVAVDGEKFLRKIIEWRLITERHDIENLLEVRMALEGVSASDTALHGSPEQIEKLRKLLTQMKSALKDEKAFAALDLEFHITLANASGNTLISDLISLIRGQLVKALHKVLVIPHALPLTHKEHTAIVDAIERHDPEAARQAMLSHLGGHLSRYTDANPDGKSAPEKANGKKVRATAAVNSGKAKRGAAGFKPVPAPDTPGQFAAK
jgi:GntR family transcriptional repressor for pyruvate dehydrogenase complex